MAQVVHTVITDDLDDTELNPSEATTVQWSWRGVDYEFDTSADTVAAMESDQQSITLGLLLTVSRKVGSRGRPSKHNSTPRRSPDVEPKAIREWARQQGHSVPARGRVPAPIRDAFLAATSTPRPG